MSRLATPTNIFNRIGVTEFAMIIIQEFFATSIEATERPTLPGHYVIEVNHGRWTASLAIPSTEGFTARLLFVPDEGEKERTMVPWERVAAEAGDVEAAQKAHDAMLPLLTAYQSWFDRTRMRWEVLRLQREQQRTRAKREGRQPPPPLRKRPPKSGNGPL